MRRLLLALSMLLLAPASALLASPAVAAVPPRASLPQIESQVMCVTCKIPLNVAESPQSERERAYIQHLIDEGRDEAQIKRALVSQFGPTVLALPSTHGFDLAAYLVPLAVLVAIVALLALLLPRWLRNRRDRSGAADEPGEVTLSPSDAARLEADLARFD